VENKLKNYLKKIYKNLELWITKVYALIVGKKNTNLKILVLNINVIVQMVFVNNV